MRSELKKYAEVAVKVGLNVQKGQQVIINAPIEAADLVRLVTDESYKVGASDVVTLYVDDYNVLSKYKNGHDESFDSSPQWLADGLYNAFDQGAARLNIIGRNPTLLEGIDPNLISRSSKARSIAFKKVMELVTSSASQWSIISYATPEWAMQVFPDELTERDAVYRLWDEIFEACRINSEDPISEWKSHNQNIHKRAKIMNDLRFDSLRYKSSTSDIVFGLADGHIWEGGSSPSKSGIMFNANIPTEEIFTTPKRNYVNGWVKSTKPLYYQGTKIDGISVEFENGKAVKVTATDGEDVLINMINQDEGASYLGEIAIVPFSSPISKSGIIFKETLFDENASCHVAFGQSYTSCMSVIENETNDEYMNRGGNFSRVHTDWMIGSNDLDIYGIKDGIETKIFENGEWIV